jgi:hypothetical protein
VRVKVANGEQVVSVKKMLRGEGECAKVSFNTDVYALVLARCDMVYVGNSMAGDTWFHITEFQ